MASIPDVDQSLITDLAWVMVEKAAPSERYTFRPVARHYFAKSPDKRAKEHGGPLEFGLPEVTVAVTPVALAVATAVLQHTIDVVAGAAVKKGVAATSAALRRLLGLNGSSSSEAEQLVQLALTRKQWDGVRELIIRTAIANRIPEGQATVMADAVLSRGMRGSDQR